MQKCQNANTSHRRPPYPLITGIWALHMVLTLGLNQHLTMFAFSVKPTVCTDKTVKYCPQLWLYDTQTRCCDIKSGHHFPSKRGSFSVISQGRAESLWPEANI